MRLHIYLVLLLCCFPIWLNAQSNCSDNGWPIVDTQTDYNAYQRKVTLTKISPSAAIAQAREYESPNIAFELIQAFLSGQLEAYLDTDLQQAAKPEDIKAILMRPDTLAFFNTETYEERIVVVERDITIDDFRNIALHCQLNYKGEGKINQVVEVVSVLLPNTDERPLLVTDPKELYFKIKTSNKIPKPRNFNLLELYSINVARKDFDKISNTIPVERLITDLTAVPPANASNFVSANGKYQPLTATEFHQIFNLTDTITTFSPETYQEEKEVISVEFSEKTIESIRLKFYLGWEKKKARLTFYPVGYAPLQSVRDEQDSLLYIVPLFHYLEAAQRK